VKHEEKTGELDRNNIIHVNFFGPRRPRYEAELRENRGVATVATLNRRRSTWNLTAPWLLRLLALVGIFILSLLVL